MMASSIFKLVFRDNLLWRMCACCCVITCISTTHVPIGPSLNVSCAYSRSLCCHSLSRSGEIVYLIVLWEGAVVGPSRTNHVGGRRVTMTTATSTRIRTAATATLIRSTTVVLTTPTLSMVSASARFRGEVAQRDVVGFFSAERESQRERGGGERRSKVS